MTRQHADGPSNRDRKFCFCYPPLTVDYWLSGRGLLRFPGKWAQLLHARQAKKHQLFHINLLKEWNDRASSMQLWARAVVEEEECQELYFPSSKEELSIPDLCNLSSDCQEALQQIMDPAQFSSKQGCTDLFQHDIWLRDPNQRCNLQDFS